ncbi:hypothetical protein CVT25_000162 [Psilocybe cyanescens]|uniref:Uncharacterized protein n=1 Tax=Psilocybe cyanescens TaxID=93625 RepID=A0A409WC39_PSICY|nr:hypothetical protein CVT25_000162 [Psilocybe cyanescens]
MNAVEKSWPHTNSAVSTIQQEGRNDMTDEITKALALLDLNSKDAATRSDEEMDINNEEVLGAFNEAGEAMEDIEDGSSGDKGRDKRL